MPGPLALLALSASYFVMGVATLSVVGLIAPMSRGLGVQPSSIALLLTSFALTYALAAPLMQILIGDWNRRKMIEIGLLTMAAGAGMGALAIGWWTLVVARILTAVGAGLVGPMSSATGAAIVPPDRRGGALGIVFAGMPIATVIGVPASAWLGQFLGWRMVMGFVAFGALLVLGAVRMVVPSCPGGKRQTPRALVGILIEPVLGPAIGVTLFQMAALFATYSLLPEFLGRDFGIGTDLMPFGLAAYGIGGILGNLLAAPAVDAVGPERLILISLVALLAVFAAFLLAPAVPIVALVLTLVWAMAGMMMIVPQQSRLIQLAPSNANLVLALNGSALYFGMAAGGARASVVGRQVGVRALPMTSGVLVGLASLAYLAARVTQRFH